MGRTDHKGKHFKKEPETREEFETPDMPQSSDRPRRMVGFKRLGFQALPEFWTFQFVAGSLLSFVLGLAGSATNALVGSLGAPITSANLSQFVATWQGILILLLWLVLLPIAVAVEVFAGVYACNDVLYGRPVKVFATLKRALLSLKRFFTLRGAPVLLYVLVAAPLCGVGFSVSVTNSLYIPHFICDVIFSTPMYCVAYVLLIAVMVVVGVAHIFVIHAMLIDGLTPSEARHWSRRAVREHWLQVLGAMVPAFLFWTAFTVFLLVLLRIGPAIYLEQLWPKVADAEVTLQDLAGSAELTDAQYNLMLYRVVSSFTVLFGSFFCSIMALLGNSYIMLRFTRCYDELAHGKRELWPARQRRHAYLRKTWTMILWLVGISLLSLGVGIFFDVLFTHDPAGVVGHRAAGTLAPENSLEGLEVAIEQGCYASEIDVQRTLDGYYVINHDDTFRRLAGEERAPKDMTFEEVRALKLKDTTGSGETLQVPTLEEMLDIIKGRERLLIELKGATADKQMVDDVVAMVREKDCVQDVVLISLKYDVIEYAEKTYPEFDTGLLFFVSVGDVSRMTCDYLLMEEELCTENRIAQVHDAGKKVGVWTVNTETGIKTFLTRDTDLIITDRIDLAKKIQQELDGRTDYEVLEDALEDIWG